jgi:hypothetical protein
MGERRWQTNLENGVVTVAIPHPLTRTDVADLKDWFALMIRILERTCPESISEQPGNYEAQRVAQAM